MKEFTEEEKIAMLKQADKLDINITMFRPALNVLSLNAYDADTITDFAIDPTSPILYDFIEDQYLDSSIPKITWQIDQQNGKLPKDAHSKTELWQKLHEAINEKKV